MNKTHRGFEVNEIVIDGVEYILTPKHNEVFIEEIGGRRYFLGPEFPRRLTYDEAIAWCASLGDGYQLPSRLVMLSCYCNEKAKENFLKDIYWTSTEYGSIYAWLQHFSNGGQDNGYKTDAFYVRAVRVEE